MVGLTQEEQKQNSPFTLEAVLEEEPEVSTNYINDALPFDKCLKADKQADEEEKKRRLYSQLETVKATREQSEKEIREWLGTDIIIKTIFKTTYSSVIAFAVSVGTTIWSWKSLQNTPQEICLVILIAMSLAIGACVLASIACIRENLISTKMNETDYMIKEDIVDCPIAAKNLFFYHVKVGELYIKVNAEKKRFEWLNNEGECCYCWSIESPFKNPEDKCNFEYQMKYLADQLEAGKVYKLADIITDKVKKKVGE